MHPYLDGQKRYYMVDLSNNGTKKKFLVHRLVCDAFVENPFNKGVVNHKDHNTHNNYYENLEWVTDQENIHHSYSTMPAARNKRKCRLTSTDGLDIFFDSCADMIRYFDGHELKGSAKSLIRHGFSKDYKLELLSIDCK